MEVSPRPYAPNRPQVCLDEGSRHLLADATPPLPLAPGQPVRQDDEYVREGVGNLCLVREPLGGRRHITVSDRRTRIDWAYVIPDLVAVQYPTAAGIGLVQDNVPTHTPASLYAAFEPAEAKRLADKVERHSPPQHGSWRTMAELELHGLAAQCLNRRLPDRATVEREVAAWEARRTTAQQPIDGRFTTADARIKLTHLYPALHD